MDLYETQVLADSVSPDGVRLTSLLCCYPRFILAELNTHRVLSRNSMSSRAVGVRDNIERVKTNPVTPIRWYSETPGMASREEVTQATRELLQHDWLWASRDAVFRAERQANLGAHKSIVNRILEPYLPVVTVITSTEWDNFFTLRLAPEAQPEMQELARSMKTAMDSSVPKQLDWGEYHIAFDPTPELPADDIWEGRLEEAVACAARVSYLTQDKYYTEEQQIRLYHRLRTHGHWSAFEHIAFCGQFTIPSETRNFRAPWAQYRAMVGG